ncbi:hypothetical protein AYY17_04645 [Morganella psychrotolerans]|uniref:Uncharacterized protein n=1 Tax=Morganella psychrotolerans TaxID=368603 RepID=A0A1B8HE15_9GAMM|nr:hypothetical protein AYY17_04645 [Morganella psychrotolerans]
MTSGIHCEYALSTGFIIPGLLLQCLLRDNRQTLFVIFQRDTLLFHQKPEYYSDRYRNAVTGGSHMRE